MTKIIWGVFNFSFIAYLFLSFIASPVYAAEAAFSLSPSTTSIGIDNNFTVKILLTATAPGTKAVAAVLTYDPGKLEIQDSAPDNSNDQCTQGINIKIGTILTQCAKNTVDTTSGKIRLELFNIGSAFSGTNGEFGTITFKAKTAGTTNVAFVITGDPQSAVYDANTAQAMTLTVINGSYTLSGGTGSPAQTSTGSTTSSTSTGGSTSTTTPTQTKGATTSALPQAGTTETTVFLTLLGFLFLSIGSFRLFRV